MVSFTRGFKSDSESSVSSKKKNLFDNYKGFIEICNRVRIYLRYCRLELVVISGSYISLEQIKASVVPDEQ